MIQVPANYFDIKNGTHLVQYRLIINGVPYGQEIIENGQGTLDLALFDTFSIGNAVGRILKLTINLTGDFRTVDLYFRLYKDEENYTTWLPKGKYFVAEQTDLIDGNTQLVCYDAMQKTVAQYQRHGSWAEPYTDRIVDLIADRIGVEIDNDTKTFLRNYRLTFTNYFIYETSATMRDYLCYIAGAFCGCFFIDDYGKLKLWRYGVGFDETFYLINEDDSPIQFGGDTIRV